VSWRDGSTIELCLSVPLVTGIRAPFLIHSAKQRSRSDTGTFSRRVASPEQRAGARPARQDGYRIVKYIRRHTREVVTAAIALLLLAGFVFSHAPARRGA
jgi:hypothetical protein